MTTLLLIRHAETAWNAEGRVQGQTDVPLSDTGHEQARKLATRLNSRRFDAIYSSDLLRAMQTAQPVAEGRGMAIAGLSELREIGFGQWEGLTRQEIQEGWPAEYAAWVADSLHSRPPGGEMVEDLQARVLTTFRQIIAAHEGQTLAIVTHGGALRAGMIGLLGLPLDAYHVFRVDNTALVELHLGGPHPRLVRCNDTAHLETHGEG
jgi:phosphoserine phosphatase